MAAVERVTRVLVVDDDALVRSGLALILDTDPRLTVAAEAMDGVDAVAAVRSTDVDVVLLDIRMPRMDGLAALAAIREISPRLPVLMLTTFDADRYILGALRAGANGFLLKDIPPRELIDAVARVAAGESMLSPSVTSRLIDHVREEDDAVQRSAAARSALGALTPKERQVADAVGQGMSNAEIGAHLYMGHPTVKTYVSRILAKLGLTNRVQVAILVHEALSG
ncbi:response regulator [Actinomycetes bacterium M1A6_2h]